MKTMILASTPSGIIGDNGKLPWPRLEGDLKRFKERTLGHVVIMGRNTFNSLPNGPLPERCNIVLTRKVTTTDRWNAFKYNMTHLNSSLKFISNANDILFDYTYEQVYIIGGAEIYKQFEEHCDEIIWTQVEQEYEGDTKFIPSKILWRKISWEQCKGYKVISLIKKY